jgi:hypothetical protein
MKDKQAERQTEAKNGLTFEELEVQGVGGLFPERIEMRRKRGRSSHHGCTGLLACLRVKIG